jgi:hypothetical protein
MGLKAIPTEEHAMRKSTESMLLLLTLGGVGGIRSPPWCHMPMAMSPRGP